MRTENIIKMLRANTRQRIEQLDGMAMLTPDEESELESLRLDLRRSYYKARPRKMRKSFARKMQDFHFGGSSDFAP